MAMPKDFASRPRATPTRKTRKPRKKPPATPNARVFHGPSFSAGALLGALLIILAAYLPNPLTPTGTNDPASAAEITEELTFEFHELLEQAQVPTDPTTYVDPESHMPDTGGEYLLQAASFRRAEDADKLRASLILMQLPAAMAKVQLDSGAWYRVLVGPFSSRTDAQRAVNQLREQNVPVMWVQKKTG
jgi:cell division protein FtsN